MIGISIGLAKQTEGSVSLSYSILKAVLLSVHLKNFILIHPIFLLPSITPIIDTELFITHIAKEVFKMKIINKFKCGITIRLVLMHKYKLIMLLGMMIPSFLDWIYWHSTNLDWILYIFHFRFSEQHIFLNYDGYMTLGHTPMIK